MDSKDFIHGEFDWFINPILAPNSFEEGNMANISPTIKINIFDKLGVEENITLGEQCTPEEIEAYNKLSRNFMMFLSGPIQRCSNLIPP